MPYDFELVVPRGKKPERLDVYITAHVENATRSKVQRAIREGAVLVNGRPSRASHPVTPGETIQITLPRPPPLVAAPENIPLDIVYEDDALLVVNKPAGMVTHPAYGNYTGTLVNALLHHCRSLSAASDTLRPGIVHRLDKDTSGLMVVAKTDEAHAALARQFAARTIRREYVAIAWGIFREPGGFIDAPLGRSAADRKKIAVTPSGKRAATAYEVITRFEYLSLVRLKLLTGRTHQIRVHLAHIHHPVFGDPTYNGRRIMYGPGTQRQKHEVEHLLSLMPRQALHARTIGFVHPGSKNEMLLESDLPRDMQAVLEVLSRARG